MKVCLDYNYSRWSGRFLGAILRVVLDGLGMGGAIWGGFGATDTLTGIDDVNARSRLEFACKALVIFGMLRLIAFAIASHPCSSSQEETCLSAFAHPRKSWILQKRPFVGLILIAWLLGVLSEWVLTCAGAVGAIWGSTDVLGIRDSAEDPNCQNAALAAGTLSFMIYLSQYAVMPSKEDMNRQTRMTLFLQGLAYPQDIKSIDRQCVFDKAIILVALILVCIQRVILQCLGAAAIWGASDFFGLRDDNVTFYRFATLVIGVGLGLPFCILSLKQHDLQSQSFRSSFSCGFLYPMGIKDDANMLELDENIYDDEELGIAQKSRPEVKSEPQRQTHNQSVNTDAGTLTHCVLR